MHWRTSGSITGMSLYNPAPFTWNCRTDSAKLFQEALKYLRQSSAAEALLNFLGGVKDLTVICTDDTVSTFYAAETVEGKGWLPKGSLVTWNPIGRLKAVDIKAHQPEGRRYRGDPGAQVQGEQSGSMGLIHEFGHARQYLLKNKWFMENYNKAIDTGDDAARYAIEDDNLLTVESVVARQLGETVRWRYDDHMGEKNVSSSYALLGPKDPVI